MQEDSLDGQMKNTLLPTMGQITVYTLMVRWVTAEINMHSAVYDLEVE